MTNLRLWDQLAKKMQDTEMQNSLKMKLASEVSRSGQNFPLPMFSRYHSMPFSLRKHSTQNISWDLFTTILGELQNNPRREVVLPYVDSTGSGTGYKTQPSSLEDEYILLHFDRLEQSQICSLRIPFYSWSSLNTFHCPKNKQLLNNNVVCIFVFANWLKQWCKFLSLFLEQVQSLKDSVTLPHN